MKNKALQHRDQLIPYEIHHKAAVTRRVHLRAAPDGSLMVIAPRRMSKRTVHKMLQERAGKVAQFLADAVERQQELPGSDYIEAEEHLYLGQMYPLQILTAQGRRHSVALSEGYLRITTADHSPQSIKKKLYAWYDKQAGQHFNTRLEVIAKRAHWIAGGTPPLRLRKMKRTWGSCSSKGIITLNRKLIKAPEACIDYVIAHELCHLKEMNHGSAFYELQELMYPQWREVRARLQSSAHRYLHE
jgi:predicted metal-dependent hydrolase